MPRFAISQHDWPTPHWDFFLEEGDTLRSWRLLAEPCANVQIPAEPIPNHRLQYLNYTGPVSGGRGNVVLWDAGLFEWLEQEPVQVILHGVKVEGTVKFIRNANGFVWWYTTTEIE